MLCAALSGCALLANPLTWSVAGGVITVAKDVIGLDVSVRQLLDQKIVDLPTAPTIVVVAGIPSYADVVEDINPSLDGR